MAPSNSAYRRLLQLKKSGLELGKSYLSREWNKGVGKIIRRRVNMPKKPM